ncbi:hypothetical protein BT93_F1599 [Corymbia citriodora subsp. variegata]|nr:hypothetical protein BT93_F1599 [Corymbia citriodora subsp. variegata]
MGRRPYMMKSHGHTLVARAVEGEREMAKRKEDIKYGTAQAKLAPDETVRVAYKHGTPLEGGHIAESERVDLFASARNISQPRPSAALPPPTADDDSDAPNKTPATSTSTT